jgi:hypothetical protein
MVERFDPLQEALEGLGAIAMKQRVRNIIRSYRNASDVLAEPIQNGMDEIERAKKESEGGNFKIKVEINISNNKIRVWDSGRGISPMDLQKWIAPDSTNKRDLFKKGSVRGHKGVGMTFLAYGFNYFSVESKTDNHHYRLRLENGREWVESENDEAPEAELDDSIDGGLDHTGTVVTIKTDPQSQPSNLNRTFNNIDMAAAMLERQTAIGIVTPPEKYDANIEAKLKYIDKNNHTEEIELATSYRYPHQKIPEEWDVFDVGEYIEGLTESEQVKPDQTDKNRYRGVYRYFKPSNIKEFVGESGGQELSSPADIEDFIDEHNVHVYGLFSYSVSYRNQLKEEWGITGNRKLHYSGARIATDGMISSWRRDISLTRSGGNKDRTWLVFHFEQIEPDLGRKDFPPEVHDVISATEQPITEHLVEKGRPFLLPAEHGGTRQDENVDQPAVKAYERKKNPISPSSILDNKRIKYGSTPEAEQDVVALFNQLVGMRLLDCYSPVYFDETYIYDSYFEYSTSELNESLRQEYPGNSDVENAEGVAEFKYHGHTLIEDIVNNTKDWTDIEFLVCWEIGRTQRSTSGDEIQFVEPASDSDRDYSGVTHIATVDSAGENPIYTISLKKLLGAF